MTRSALDAPLTAAEVLQRSPVTVLRRLSVQESAERVLLHGRLPSYYLKQQAQELLKPVLAGRVLVNEVVVDRS